MDGGKAEEISLYGTWRCPQPKISNDTPANGYQVSIGDLRLVAMRIPVHTSHEKNL